MNGQDIRTMHPREIVRGLMRGHKPDFKQGYTAENAVGAVVNLLGDDLTDAEADALLEYAQGFEAGMLEDSTLTNPGRRERIADEWVCGGVLPGDGPLVVNEFYTEA